MNLPLKDYLARQIAPVASRLDSEPALLFEAFRGLGDRALLTPKAPTNIGGLALNTLGFWQFQALIAQHSGTLAFLQTQHQSAAGLLLSGTNQTLIETYLPAMSTGAKRIGVGFSQLRRQPAPLTAESIAGGYRINGEVPWVSGAGLFTEFVGAAELPDGSAVFGLLPLSDTDTSTGQIAVSQPMALMAMSATRTVSLSLKNYFLPNEQVVNLRPAGWIAQSDRANPLSPLGLILGCAQAGVGIAARSLSKRQIQHPLPAQLQHQIDSLWVELPKRHALPVEAYDQKVEFRGNAIALMNTCAQTAVLASSGAANAIGHPAQRVYKEALVFSVSGQSNGSAIASLNALLPTPKLNQSMPEEPFQPDFLLADIASVT